MDTPAAQSAAFIPLIQDFVEMRVSAQDFETRYRRLVDDYPEALHPSVSKAVHYLFGEVDAPELDEHRLRTRARKVLRDLRRIQHGRGRPEGRQ